MFPTISSREAPTPRPQITLALRKQGQYTGKRPCAAKPGEEQEK